MAFCSYISTVNSNFMKLLLFFHFQNWNREEGAVLLPQTEEFPLPGKLIRHTVSVWLITCFKHELASSQGPPVAKAILPTCDFIIFH